MKNKKTEDEYKEAAQNSLSVDGMCRHLKIKPHGGNYSTIHNKIKQYEIDISHFTGQGWNVGLIFKPHYLFVKTNFFRNEIDLNSFIIRRKYLSFNNKKQIFG